MLTSASPSSTPTRPTVPGPVAVVADQHHVGRREVHRVLLEPDQARLAVGHGPGEDHGLPVGVSAVSVSSAQKAPALGVLRSTTVIPRAARGSPR